VREVVESLTTSDDRERFETIQIWIAEEHKGNIDQALQASPLIALSNGQLLDGWHRLIVWLRHPCRKYPLAIVGSP
jgi:hypothetical protein